MLLDLMRGTAAAEMVKCSSLEYASTLGLGSALLDLPSVCLSISELRSSCSGRFCLRQSSVSAILLKC